jgi:hypothetical protein
MGVSPIFSEGKFELDIAWGTLFITGLIIYLTLRTLKKRTRILHVEKR